MTITFNVKCCNNYLESMLFLPKNIFGPTFFALTIVLR